MNHIDAGTTISRKEREKKTREQEILFAARALFAEKGYHNTTLDDIAHKAEFAKGTIYNYFTSKDDLLFGIIDSIFDEMHAITTSTMTVSGAGAREKILAYSKAVIAHSIEHMDLFRLIMQEVPQHGSIVFCEKIKQFHERQQEIRKIVARTLAEEIRKGTVKKAEPLDLVFLFDGMLRFYCMHDAKGLHPMKNTDAADVANLMVSIFFDGIHSS